MRPGDKCNTCNANSTDSGIKLKRCQKCRSVWYVVCFLNTALSSDIFCLIIKKNNLKKGKNDLDISWNNFRVSKPFAIITGVKLSTVLIPFNNHLISQGIAQKSVKLTIGSITNRTVKLKDNLLASPLSYHYRA